MKPRVTLVVLVAVVLVAALYVLLHGVGSQGGTYRPQPRVYHLVIAEGRLTEGPSVLDATQGDQVTLAVTVDKASTLHLHGYEKLMEATPASDATLSFTATRAGFFPLALHKPDGSDTTVAALQVQPPP